MTNATPQLTPDELVAATGASEGVPELEPGMNVAEIVEEGDFIAPDTEPAAAETEGQGPIEVGEAEELVFPEFSPVEAGVIEAEEAEMVGPEEVPPSD